jgi:hypothetical protein
MKTAEDAEDMNEFGGITLRHGLNNTRLLMSFFYLVTASSASSAVFICLCYFHFTGSTNTAVP